MLLRWDYVIQILKKYGYFRALNKSLLALKVMSVGINLSCYRQDFLFQNKH